MAQTSELLRRVPVFEGLPDDQIAWFLGQAQEMLLGAGETYAREGDPADAMFVLLEGEFQGRGELAGETLVLSLQGGQVTGLLPFSRMKQFTFTPPLKTLLGTADAMLNIFECMETRKILLVDLTGVGKANGNVIGQLLVSKIQQAAFRRESQPRDRRVPFFLYADEFQNFQTSAFDSILSEAGGYKLCLTLANQGLYQLEPKIKDAIFTNVTGGWAVFHIDEKDVPNFTLKTKPIEAEQLASLPPHTAFVKIGTDDPAIVKMPPPVGAAGPSFADSIRARTEDAYGAPAKPVSKINNGPVKSQNGMPARAMVASRNNGDSDFFE